MINFFILVKGVRSDDLSLLVHNHAGHLQLGVVLKVFLLQLPEEYVKVPRVVVDPYHRDHLDAGRSGGQHGLDLVDNGDDAHPGRDVHHVGDGKKLTQVGERTVARFDGNFVSNLEFTV